MASRRSLFAGSAIMLLDAPAALAGAAHPDAAIFSLCAEHDDLERRQAAIWHAFPSSLNFEQEQALEKIHMDPLADRQEEIIARLCGIDAKTPQGLLAKMAWLAAFDPDEFEPSESDGTVVGRMLPGIFRNGLALHAPGTGSA